MNGGYALRIDALFYYSKITENQFTGGVYMNTHDANTIEKCLFTGTGVGVTLNLENGVRNNTIRECCFTTRKEALRIIDGSNVRFLNNQCEQPDVGLSTSEFSAMLVIQGAVRRCENTIIAENNFGGGTNLNRLLYIDNASQTIIEKNNLIAVGTPPDFAGKEIELTANAIYTVVRPDNRVATTLHNVRTRTAFKAEVIDAGEGTSGVLKDFATANGWNGGDFFKDANGIVHFWETLTPGTLTAGTLIGTLPVGFRPPGTAMRYHTGYTSGGNGAISISPTTGEVKIISMPAGTNLTLPSFPTGTTAPSV